MRICTYIDCDARLLDNHLAKKSLYQHDINELSSGSVHRLLSSLIIASYICMCCGPRSLTSFYKFQELWSEATQLMEMSQWGVRGRSPRPIFPLIGRRTFSWIGVLFAPSRTLNGTPNQRKAHSMFELSFFMFIFSVAQGEETDAVSCHEGGMVGRLPEEASTECRWNSCLYSETQLGAS